MNRERLALKLSYDGTPKSQRDGRRRGLPSPRPEEEVYQQSSIAKSERASTESRYSQINHHVSESPVIPYSQYSPVLRSQVKAVFLAVAISYSS